MRALFIYLIRKTSPLFQLMPVFILQAILNILYKFSPKLTRKFFQFIPQKKIQLLKCTFIKKSQILSELKSNKFKYKLLAEERYEQVRTPDIFKITKNNFVNLRQAEISLYLFENASFYPKSDIISFKNQVFWEKANRSEFSQMMPMDSDFIAIDFPKKFLYHFITKKVKKFDVGFSLCGVHTGAWAHFLLSYLPKLISLKHVKDGENVVLILPQNMHQHHREMINLFLESHSLHRKIQIESVEDDVAIHCERLFYCNAIGFLSDSGLLVSPASASISKYGSEVTADFLKFLHGKVPESLPRKIYIGRGKERNNTNAIEVDDYFAGKGFETIYPHLLTLSEKIEIFGNATHICGPISSGFANLVFCKNKVKILGFFNYARAFDPFISGLNHAGNLGHEIMFVTGYEPPSHNVNNSYYIDIDRVIAACNEMSYFD